MRLTITEAAVAAGVARSTIYDRVKAGELTRTPDKRIDVVDLLRLYPTLNTPGEGGLSDDAELEPQDNASSSASDAWVRDLVAQQAATIDRLHAQLEQAATDLREADARSERREASWRSQVDRLSAMLPAPADQPPAPRGLLARLFG